MCRIHYYSPTVEKGPAESDLWALLTEQQIRVPRSACHRLLLGMGYFAIQRGYDFRDWIPTEWAVCHGLHEYGMEKMKEVKMKMNFCHDSETDRILSPKGLFGWHVFQPYVVLYGRGAFDRKAEELNRKKIKTYSWPERDILDLSKSQSTPWVWQCSHGCFSPLSQQIFILLHSFCYF